MVYLCHNCKMLLGQQVNNNHIVFPEAQEAKEDTARKASRVEAEIRRLEDYIKHTERDTVQAERRLEELVKREEADREKDRRTRQRMEAYAMSIELTRLGAKAQQEEAD